MDLTEFTRAVADGIGAADATRPVAFNQRSGNAFQPGIGPHTENATIGLTLGAIAAVAQRKAILIFGYEDADTPLVDAIDAFETLANQRVPLGPRREARFDGLIHPVASTAGNCSRASACAAHPSGRSGISTRLPLGMSRSGSYIGSVHSSPLSMAPS